MKAKRFIAKVLSAVLAAAMFVTPLSDHIPIIGDGMRVSAAVIGDDYPSYYKSFDIDEKVDEWNFYNRECTSFVAWRLNSANGVNFTNQYGGVSRWGNGGDWGDVARGLGITVDNTPAVGAVYYEAATAKFPTGHVAWVAEVDGDNVTIEEYNYYTNVGGYNCRTVSASAASGYIHIADIIGEYLPPYPDYEYYVSDDGAVTIYRYTGSGEKIEIPSTIYGKPVKEIYRGAFFGCTTLTEVIIPNSVTEIGDGAFWNCTSLTAVVISNGVTKIEQNTFYECTSLTKVVIPDSVTEIGDGAFWGCTSLTKAVIPNSVTKIGRSAFQFCESLADVEMSDNVTEIGQEAFSNCTSLKEITIPNSVTEIGTDAFHSTGLTEVIIPDSVTKIGSTAFASCESLVKVEIHGNVTEIGNAVFAWCYNLKSVKILGSKTKIGVWEFYLCKALTDIEIPNGVTEIGTEAFRSAGLTEVIIPDSVTKIGELAFCECDSLTNAEIPSGVTSIGDLAFYHCESLKAINVSRSNKHYTSIDGVLFDKAVTTLICYPQGKENTAYSIPRGVTKIEGSAFFDCDAITEVTMPDGLTELGERAFMYCNHLASAKIPASVTSIGEDAFYHCWYLTFYGYTGSYAETYARENGIKFAPVIDFVNKATAIKLTAEEGIIPTDAQLIVQQTSQTNTSVSYNITLTSSGKEIQPNGAVTVSIPVPAGWNSDDINVYHRDGSGRLTNMNAVVSGSSVVFTTDHFSEYIITTEKLVTTIRGDVNNSGGTPNNDDLIALAQYLANWTIEINMEAANVDGDAEGKVNNDDLIMLAQLLAGWNV